MLNGINNLEDLDLQQLEKVAFELDCFFFAELKMGEPYAPNYRHNRKAFKTLVRKTVKLRNSVMRFFKGQAERLPYLVKIPASKLKFGAGDDLEYDPLSDFNPDNYLNIQLWNSENDKLAAEIHLDLENLFDTGIMSTELKVAIDTGLSSQDAPAAKFLRDYTLNFVKEINQTTRDRITEQMQTSIAAGETKDELVNRLTKVILNPKRAAVIAQTESVRAFSNGRFSVLKQLGYKTKVWIGPQASDGDICPNGEVKKIDEPFSNGEMFPPAHPNCRCGYEQADDLSKDDVQALKDRSI